MQSIKVKRKVTSSSLRISGLKKFIGKHVEIIVTESNEEVSGFKAAGILSDFKNSENIANEKLAWGIVASEKHGNS